MVVQIENDPQQGRSILSAQEVSFAKVLAGNEKKKRDQGLKKLVKWLTYRSSGVCEFTENDFMTIWTGLYYSMWMSDKPLVQEELADNLSQLIHCFAANEDAALLFIKCFYLTMSQSWAGLDQYRMDKFCMLARRFLRQSLEYCAKKKWEMRLVKRLMRLFDKVVLDESTTLGLKLHFIEVFLEELAKVGRDDLKTSLLTKILAPFIRLVATTKDVRVRTQLDGFFRHLIRQTDVALEYEEKFQAWKSAGFPGGDINLVVPDDSEPDEDEPAGDNNVEDILDDDEKEEEEMMTSEAKVLDPRAGSVHVELPQIPVPPASIIKVLKRYESIPESTLKGRRMVKALIGQFRSLKRGKCPYGVKKVPTTEKFGTQKYINKCAMKLIKDSLITKQEKRKKRNKIKRLNEKLNKQQEDESTPGEGVADKKIKNKVGKHIKKKKQNTSDSDVVVLSVESSKSSPNEKSDMGKSVVNGKVGSPAKSSPKAESGGGSNDILKALYLGQARKRKNSEESELTTDKSVVLDRKKMNLVEDIVKQSPKMKDGETSPGNKISTDMQNGGKENRNSNVSPKKRKVDFQEKVSPVEQSVKKRRSSTGSWLVDEVESDQGVSPPKIITLEKKDPWAEPLQEGETEIIVPNRRASGTPVFWQKALAKVNVTPSKTPSYNTPISSKGLNDSVSGRKISFNLSMNRAQEKQEYLDEVKRSPQIPFDSAKKPKQSALKAGLLPSPINPFYRSRKLLL